jgi:hypothetical protein
MNQVLNIFRKDTRRFWPEIVLSLVITAAFALIYPVQWLPDTGERVRELQILANVLTGLVPVSWWLLIGRVVHAETLVGDRQFWITRPYEWKKLLGAKVLFLLVWLYLPFFAAQSLLLAEAGFHPLSYVPGLLFGLLLATGILVMPLFAVAAITANFARLTLTLLGALIALLVAAIAANLGNRYTASIPSSDRFTLPLVLCLCGAAVLLQYAARRVWQARVLLIAGLVLIGAVLFAASRSQDSQVNRYYPPPASASAAPFQLRLAPDSKRKVTDRQMNDNDRYIDVPLLVSGVTDGYAIQIDNLKATFTGQDGFSWTSPWQGVYGQRFLPDTGETQLQIRIDPAAYERLLKAPTGLHLNLALTRLKAGATTSVVLPRGDVVLPGFGICSIHPDFSFVGYSSDDNLDCRFALHQPRLTYLSTIWSDEPCSSAQPTPEHAAVADGWTGDLSNPDPAEFGITPVWTPYVNFNIRRVHNGMPDLSSTHWRLCPGAPFRATQYSPVDRTQTSLTLTNFLLPANVVPTS